ncbi:MAG: hypothetical protein ABF308_09325 [Phaeobacter gallaeciensis]|jgi:flagellar basal body-associated protein FliL
MLRPSRTTLSFLLPMLALPLGMLVASVMAVTQPVSIKPEPEPAPVEPTEPAPEARIYHAFLTPVTVTLPKTGGTLNVLLGVALPESVDKALKKKMQDSPDAILGNLATSILDAIDTTGTINDPAQLRQMLPGALQTAMNANLVAMGETPDILEVLIIDWALLP